MRRRHLILTTPARRAGNLAESDQPFIGMDLDNQEGRYRMDAAFRTDGEMLVDRNLNRDRFDGSDLHCQVTKSCTNELTSRTIASKKRSPFSAVARSGCPSTPLSEISRNSFTE